MQTLVELLRERARSCPADKGYRYLLSGDVDGPVEALSFARLEERARILGAELQRVVAPGERAVLLYPDGLEYLAGFFGCAFAGVIAVPAYPPDKARWARTVPRLLAILRDSGASVVLTTEGLRREIEAQLGPTLDPPLRWISTDRLPEARAAAWVQPQITPDTIAFLQYTSGSTSSPKGVEISHRNLLHTLDDLAVGWDHDEDSVLVSWLPVFHDLGLVYGLLQPLHGGFSGVVFSPVAFLRKPLRWLEAITRFRGTHAAAPNFAFDLCVKRTTDEERAALDLSSWKLVLNAAEPIRVETMQRFQDAFGPRGFHPLTMTPGYGLAEATLKVTTVARSSATRVFPADPAALERGRAKRATDPAHARHLVGCGRPALGAVVRIVDPETRSVVADGTIGEVWVAGASIARGYWRSREASQEAFGHSLAGEPGAFLRTGDLGFLDGGELFIGGRRKDLIIVDGKNHYPQDLELSAERAHGAVRPGCAAAFSVERGEEERVVLFCEIDPRTASPLAWPDVASAIASAVRADHQLSLLAVWLLPPGTIAKTSSGKIQRSACRAAFSQASLEPLYRSQFMENSAQTTPRTQDSIERWLYAEVAKTLGVHPADLQPKDSLEDAGLKSSQIISLSGQLEKWLGRKLDQNAITETNTIPEIAKALAG